MVEIIDEQPGYGSILGRSLGNALVGGAQGYLQRKQSQKQSDAFKRLTGMDLGGLPPEVQNQFAKEFAKVQAQQQFSSSGQENEMIKQKYGIDLSGIQDPKIRQTLMNDALKKGQEQQQQAEESQGVSDALNWLDENAEYAGSTLYPGKSFLGGKSKGNRFTIFDLPINRAASGTREEIDATGFWVTDKIYTHFNKGQISNVKLETIRKDLSPRSDISERAYKARVAALRRISNLPPNAPKSVVDQTIDREIKAVKKIEKATGNKEQERPSLEEIFG